jgi:hypothetical protein
MLFNYYKELITIILRKENKKDYSFSSNYRSIALENILAKVVKKNTYKSVKSRGREVYVSFINLNKSAKKALDYINDRIIYFIYINRVTREV